MTTELFFLTLTAILLASLWIPFVVGVNTTPYDGGRDHDFGRIPPDMTKFPAWVQRANRAHLNLLEQFAPFAALVLIAHVAGISNDVTVWSAVAFFWLRVAHAVGMVTGLAGIPVRPILFTAAWLAVLAFASQILLVA